MRGKKPGINKLALKKEGKKVKSFLREFKEFALRGNVMSLAVGVLIGGAFQAVVTSLTNNILSPIIGLFTRKNFDALTWEIFGVSLGYGSFITAVINFVIMAFIVFLIVRAMNRLLTIGKKPEEPAPEAPKCPYCLSEVKEKASRCPHCTSVLSQPYNEDEQA